MKYQIRVIYHCIALVTIEEAENIVDATVQAKELPLDEMQDYPYVESQSVLSIKEIK